MIEDCSTNQINPFEWVLGDFRWDFPIPNEKRVTIASFSNVIRLVVKTQRYEKLADK